MISLSVVVPVFNEEKNLPRFFTAFDDFLLENKDFLLELVFVNDGSTDKTDVLLREFANGKENVKVISYRKNRGKGYAVRTGMLAAQGEWRLFMDADLAVSFGEIKKIFSSPLQSPIVIGSRVIDGSRIKVPQGRMRSFLGACFTFLANIITGVGVTDFTCGFKCFSKEATQTIFLLAQIDRWSYDAEILYIAKKQSLPVCEIPVTWRNGSETRVRPGGMVEAFIDLLRIMYIHR